MNPKSMLWDYPDHLKDDLWRARRMAEFFPFVLEELTEEDRKTLLRRLDEINVPDERKEFISMVCSEKQDTMTAGAFSRNRCFSPCPARRTDSRAWQRT